MSVGGVGGGGGGGGGAGGAGGASGPSSSGGPSGAGRAGGDSGGPSKSGSAGGDKGGPSKAGDSASAKSTGDVGKTGDTGKVSEAGKVDAQEQAKEAERQRAQNEIKSDKFTRTGPTTSSDVVQNMMKSQGISPTGAANPANATNPADPANTAPPPAAGAGSTTSDPALAQTTANVEQSKDIAKTETKDSTVKETAKSIIGNALDAIGSTYQAFANGVDKAASRALASTVVKTVGDAVGGALKTVTDKVGGLLDKSANKAAAAWGTSKQLVNFGASAALRGIGGVISAGADIVQNGVPQSWREAGALAVKNTISGAAAAGLGFVGGLVAGPPGAIGGAVAGGYLADGFAGRVADGIFGTNRYTSPEAAPAPAAAPQFVDESYIAA